MTAEIELPMRIVTPDGRWTIEVTGAEDGPFNAFVILDGTTTTESLTTMSPDELINWCIRQMKEAMRRTNGT